MKPELIILMGLPGAGKSSFYRKNFSAYKLVSKDQMKSKKHKSLIQKKQIKQYLKEGHSVVVDNTNVTRLLRKELVDIAHSFEARVILYYFPLSVNESLKLNEGINRVIVPKVAIYTFKSQLEHPEFHEGFDEQYQVKMISPEEFEISPLANREVYHERHP